MLMFYLSLIDDTGDKAIFEDIYKQYENAVMKYAMSLLHNQYDAEEAAQEMWMAAAVNFDKIKMCPPAYIRAYIFKVTGNKAYDILRKKQRRSKVFCDAELDDIAEKIPADDSVIYQVCAKLSCQIVRDCINSLDEIYTEVLNHYYLNTMNTREIAKLIGIKEGTVRARLSKGKLLLLSKLKERGIQ